MKKWPLPTFYAGIRVEVAGLTQFSQKGISVAQFLWLRAVVRRGLTSKINFEAGGC